MGHKVYQAIVQAVESEALSEPFGRTEFREACPGLGTGTYNAFLDKHAIGNPGGDSELFERVSPGRFRLLRPPIRLLASVGRAETLLALANEVAARYSDFSEIKGPGRGNRATNDFVGELQRAAVDWFGQDFSEATVCGSNKLAVDYYFPDEATIVEVAFGLRNPNTEFEKDILKALIAKSYGKPVERLFFIARPGGRKKCHQPGRSEFVTWLEETHGITVEVHDLDPRHA